jgi:hypothetical protein
MLQILQIILDNILPVLLAFIGAFGTIVGIAIAVYNIAKKTGVNEARSEAIEKKIEQAERDNEAEILRVEGEIKKQKDLLYQMKDKYMLHEHIILDMQRILTDRVDAANAVQKENIGIYTEIREKINQLNGLLAEHFTTHRVEKQTRQEMHDELMKKGNANPKK